MKAGDPRRDRDAMCLQQQATLAVGRVARMAQLRVAQHVPDWHPRRLQTMEEFDPGQDGRIVVTLPPTIAIRIGQQSDPLVVTDGMGGQPAAPGEFADLHDGLFRSRRRNRYRFERTPSQAQSARSDAACEGRSDDRGYRRITAPSARFRPAPATGPGRAPAWRPRHRRPRPAHGRRRAARGGCRRCDRRRAWR